MSINDKGMNGGLHLKSIQLTGLFNLKENGGNDEEN